MGTTWWIPVAGWVIMLIFVCVVALIVCVVGLALVALVTGLLGHPIPRSQDWHKASHVRPPIPLALRTAVLERDHWQCVYCGSKENLQMDHVIPVSRGGATVMENLETLCRPCNEEKGAR